MLAYLPAEVLALPVKLVAAAALVGAYVDGCILGNCFACNLTLACAFVPRSV